MPISTVPNTPALHTSGSPPPETLLRSPNGQVRMRWFDSKGPAATGGGGGSTFADKESGQEETEQAPLIAGHSPGSSPSSSSASAFPQQKQDGGARRLRSCFTLTSALLIVCAALVVVSRETEMVSFYWSKVFSSSQTSSEAQDKVASLGASGAQGWVYVTGTSPHALEQACEAQSAEPVRDDATIQRETSDSITDAFISRASRGESTVLCGPPPLSLKELEALSSIRVIIYVEDDGLAAAFDPRFVIWARARGIEADVEDHIDETCLKRRKATRRKYSCTITEIGVLRAATIWRKWQDEIESLKGKTGLEVVRLTVVNEMSSKKFQELRHKALVTQVLQDHLGLPLSSVDDATLPERPPSPIIDSGYCKSLRPGMESNLQIAKAICLPNFVIIGAQKSGSDEVAVWLNKNKYNRRMDGGVEVHFFDCLGRGQGEERFSCERRRSFSMVDQQHGSFEIFNPNATSSQTHPFDFSWTLERKKSPFIDDVVWQSYMRLGHLNNKQFYLDPSRTLVFEKTPSYLDLADPRDVVRLIPRAKFIIITRDPVQRLLSSYFQFCENPEKDGGDCTIDEFVEYATQLCDGTLDLETPGPQLIRRQAFHRAALHGEYYNFLERWTKYFWVDDETMADKQFLVVDHHHFRFTPLAVMYAIESFTGNRGPIRHFKYQPTFKSGYYVLGDYSKAFHPSHAQDMPDDVRDALKKFYRPSAIKLRELLLRPNGPVTFGLLPGESFTVDHTSTHPDLFAGDTRFNLPPWLKLKELGDK